MKTSSSDHLSATCKHMSKHKTKLQLTKGRDYVYLIVTVLLQWLRASRYKHDDTTSVSIQNNSVEIRANVIPLASQGLSLTIK